MLQQAIARLGGSVRHEPDGTFEVAGVGAEEIGRAAAAEGIVLFELTPHQASLEEAFMEITRGEVEYGHEEAAA
jgi:ABC-2 type transport system ATP-binding protein